MGTMKISKDAWLGFVIGIISPFLFLPLILLIMSYSFSYEFSYFWDEFFTNARQASKYLSLSSIPNLLWFYLFLNRERFSVSRGIIFATLVFVPLAIYVNWF